MIHYLNDFSAQVRTPTGLEVETSTAPLRVATGSGKKLPVDLELESTAGHIEPRRPLTPVVIGGHAEGGISLTNSGISLTMLGTNSQATMIEGKEAFYGEVAGDIDAVATPKLNGADLSALIRSAKSPEELRYRVGVPVGAKLMSEGGGAVIRRGQETLARIPAPWARDAQGTSVPTEMQIHGDELQVNVAHRKRSYAYPLILDPELLEEITESPEEWKYSSGIGTGNEAEDGIAAEGGSFTHSGPGAGAPLTLTDNSGALPFEITSEGGAQLADKFISQQDWAPNPYGHINRIYFDGISSSGATGPNSYSDFQIESCGRYLTWSGSEAAPTAFVFTALDFWNNCSNWVVPGSSLMPSHVRIRAVTGTSPTWEQEQEWRYNHVLPEQVTVGPATISVAAIVVARPLSWQEEQELKLLDPEKYGDGNPAELSNTNCFTADPINCATGNLTETQQDLSVGGIGLGLHADRTYNSQLTATQEAPGGFGFGWTGSYEDRIDVRESCIANCEEIITADAADELDGEGAGEEASEGLVAAYSFDEDKGEVAGDSVGGHDASISGAKWTPGRFGPALKFNWRESDHATVPSSPELELTGPFTIDAWVRPDESRTFATIALKEAEGKLGYILEAGGNNPGVPAGFIFTGSELEDLVSAAEELPIHTWSNLALTFDGEDMRLYVDGALVGTAAADAPRGGSGELQIGEGFTGKIDELRIYDRALDAKEIQADETTPIGTTEGSEEAGEPEEGAEVREQVAVVHQDNGSTAEFRRIAGKATWMPVNPLVRAELTSEGAAFAYTLPDQTVLRFGSSGRLSAEEDRNGDTVTVHCNEEGRISSVSDASGRELVYSYDPEGFVKSIEDPMGHVVHYEYEGGNLVGVSQPGSTESRWRFGYDHDHQLTSMTDGRGGTTKTKYKAFRAVRQEDPMGRVTSWTYTFEKGGSTTAITEPNGSETVERFDESGLIGSVTRASGTPQAATTTYEYNPDDELTAVTDADERTTVFSYGLNGDKVGEADPEGDETKWTYNEAHEVVSETTPRGEKTTITRNANGDPEAVSRPAPGSKTQTVSYEYGPHGEVKSMTGPLGATWTYGYDKYGDLESETDPEGDKRTWGYNEDSQVTSTVSPRGNEEGAEAAKFTTTIERDARGRPIKVTDPFGGTTERTYDADGNLESITDPNGRKTKFSYDADNERTKVELPNGDVEETGYDGAGQVTSQTNGNKRKTTYVRNVLEQPVEIIDPLERKTVQTFDAAGNLKTKTDPDGRTTTFAYDKADRLKEIAYSAEAGQDVTFGYNADGQPTSMVDGTGESTWEYDQLGRLIHSKDGNGETVSWEYNLGDEPVGLTYPNGKSISRAYDKAGRLESVTDWLGHTTSFSYNKDSAPTLTTFPVGTTDTDEYAWDRADRMSSVTMKKGAETLASLAYSRDPAGQLESLVSKGLPGAETESFSYDEDERLTKAGSAEFGYDAADNITRAPGTTNAFDKASQIESATGASFTFDKEGERTEETPSGGPATAYKYSQAGNLTAIERPEEGETPAISESFGYDGNGLLASRTVGLSTTHFVWDLSESPGLLLSDGADSYLYGPGGIPFEQISSGKNRPISITISWAAPASSPTPPGNPSRRSRTGLTAGSPGTPGPPRRRSATPVSTRWGRAGCNT